MPQTRKASQKRLKRERRKPFLCLFHNFTLIKNTSLASHACRHKNPVRCRVNPKTFKYWQSNFVLWQKTQYLRRFLTFWHALFAGLIWSTLRIRKDLFAVHVRRNTQLKKEFLYCFRLKSRIFLVLN